MIKEKLLDALAEVDIDPIFLEIYRQRISSSNGRTLRQKIETLRDHYNLSKEVFNDEEIRKITKARNTIVHTGESVGRREIWPKVVFVRELIAHIVFHEIGYPGPHESYIGGYRSVD